MLLIIAAAPLETSLLRQQLTPSEKIPLGSCQVRRGTLLQQEVLLAHSGIGMTAMALQLTRLLIAYSPSAVLLCGCGGSYPGSGLGLGDLALASAEIYGDLGTTSEKGFIPLNQLEIPQPAQEMLLTRQSYSLDPTLLVWAQTILPEAKAGSFVTVNNCSGTQPLSAALQRQTAGICENMEGAAAAQVCAEFQVPLLEIRGISNLTGTRDPAHWDIAQGAERAQQAILSLLQNWPAEGEKPCSD